MDSFLKIVNGLCPPNYNGGMGGGLNLKMCQIFVKFLWGQNFFFHLWGDKRIWGQLKLYWGNNIYYCTFIPFFRNRQQPERWSVSFKNFFRKCEYIRSFYMLISSNILKKSFRKNSTFCAYCDRCFGKKCSVSSIFQTIVAIVVIKILEKYCWRSSVLERNF